MSKSITDLREHLFAAIQGVRDGSVSIEQAKTISDLSQVIVNTAKVEVDFMRATERRSSAFLGDDEDSEPSALPNGIVRVVQHRIRD